MIDVVFQSRLTEIRGQLCHDLRTTPVIQLLMVEFELVVHEISSIFIK
jgi:hypothetical protein